MSVIYIESKDQVAVHNFGTLSVNYELTVFIPASFDLVSRCCNTKQKISGESKVTAGKN